MRAIVFAEKEASFAKLRTAARAIGCEVENLQVEGGPWTAAALPGKTWRIKGETGYMLEDYSETIAGLMSREAFDLLLVESTKRCKVVAGRVAAILGTSASVDVMGIDEGLVASRMIYGGAAVRKERSSGATSIVVVDPATLPDAEGVVGELATVEDVHFVEPGSKVRRVAVRKKEKASVNLTAAKRIIGVGRGVVNEEDLVPIRQLAEAIGAEVGCTRPIAEGEKWMPRETYIGVSGLMLAPETYIALGVSGQIQHMVGVNQAKTIIAVNKDRNAIVFQQADYGIVADLYKVLPALNAHFC